MSQVIPGRLGNILQAPRKLFAHLGVSNVLYKPKGKPNYPFYAYIEFAHHRAKLYYGLTTGGLGRRARSSCQYEA